MHKLQTTTFSWLLHSRKMHLLPFWAFLQSGGGERGKEWMGVLRHVPQEMFWILTPLSPLSNSILACSILFRWDLVNRRIMGTIYVSIMKNLTISIKLWKLVWIHNWYPFQAELLRIGHYTEYPRVATLNCEYFYYPLNGMPSPSQGYPKQ